MEFLDEDAKPRFLFQSRPNSSALQIEQQRSKLFFLITVSISLISLILSIILVQSEPFRSILIWISLSLLVGPFAPNSLTGGDIRVGQGPILEIPDEEPEMEEDTKKRIVQKRQKPRRSEEIVVAPVEIAEKPDAALKEEKRNGTFGSSNNGAVGFTVQEMDWEEEELRVLKKQLAKHPAGKPRRWEIIAEAFGGRHKVESVIKMAKELGEKKVNDGDSYAQFLKKRKPVDKRMENPEEERVEDVNNGGRGEVDIWNSGEDIALLNGLKAFPKDTPMRWEKIAASISGKSKAACIKRVAELKRDFRNSKSAN